MQQNLTTEIKKLVNSWLRSPPNPPIFAKITIVDLLETGQWTYQKPVRAWCRRTKTGSWTYAETGLWTYAETGLWTYAETGSWGHSILA